MSVQKAVVIGAGIGGLTTAIGLRQAGVDVKVFERRTEPSRLLTGGGFMLWHNAFVALRKLSLDDQVAKVSSEILVHEFRSDSGRTLARWQIGPEAQRIGAPAVALRRSDLNSLLLEEAGDSVVMGAQCVGFEQDAEGVTARFADGSVERADVLIGADGMRSAVRSTLRHGHDLPPRYAGYTAWQAIAELPGEDVVPSGTFFNLWGRNGLRFLYCRLNDREVYWDAITSDETSAAFDMFRKTKRDVMCETYAHWPDPIPRILAATREDAILPIDIADRPPTRDAAWGHGRVVLVGDAAHAMTLNLSQGAGQAIEDGVVLSGLLAREPDLGTAVAQYEKVRRERVEAMVRGAYRIGELGKWRGSLVCGARDLFMRAFFGTFAKKGTYRLMMNFDY
ncbi:FAD-dependent monooxygenase [Streptomyces sp. NPDC059866]|uniref:FAD-dependent monooxygenase n=1 Tax=Streptomyces sp. NPDC059866 TaxID=3346978 RepID=UPI00365F6A85